MPKNNKSNVSGKRERKTSARRIIAQCERSNRVLYLNEANSSVNEKQLKVYRLSLIKKRVPIYLRKRISNWMFVYFIEIINKIQTMFALVEWIEQYIIIVVCDIKVCVLFSFKWIGAYSASVFLIRTHSKWDARGIDIGYHSLFRL